MPPPDRPLPPGASSRRALLSAPGTLQITVPATSANLGAGFDVLGLALQLYNTFLVAPAETTRVEVVQGQADVPADTTNLFYRAFAHLYRAARMEPPPLYVRMRLDIPAGRGLGSSATAVVGGLLAANAYLGHPYPAEALLAHAVALEHGGHPDNVAPALLGGLVVNVQAEGGVTALAVPFPEDLRAVLFMPDFDMDTVAGRALMPKTYPSADVVFNSSRVALFIAAITQQRYDLLRVAMEDRLHQPYRTQLFPAMPGLIAAALEAGAHGACLSGGGSCILALATQHRARVAAALEVTAHAVGLRGHSLLLDIDRAGAQVTAEAPL